MDLRVGSDKRAATNACWDRYVFGRLRDDLGEQRWIGRGLKRQTSIGKISERHGRRCLGRKHGGNRTRRRRSFRLFASAKRESRRGDEGREPDEHLAVGSNESALVATMRGKSVSIRDLCVTFGSFSALSAAPCGAVRSLRFSLQRSSQRSRGRCRGFCRA